MEDVSLVEAVGLIGVIISGINFVVIAIAKTFWNLTFNRKKDDDERRFQKIEEGLDKIEDKVNSHEEKNKYFRHNFESVTKGLEIYISSEIKHLGEMIGLQISNIMEKINSKTNAKK